MTGPGLVAGVAALGAVGALARFAVDREVARRAGAAAGRLPLGTLVVNATGSLALGILVGAALDGGDRGRLVGAGLIGAYTTASTWLYESVLLAEDGDRRVAVANLAGSAALGLALALVGRAIGGAL